MNTWNAGQILSVVRTINKMDINYLGDDSSIDQSLIQFLNISLMKLVRLCYNVEVTDEQTITGDGTVTWTKGNAEVKNMFEPLRMLLVTGGVEQEIERRYSDTSPRGWYCEAPNQPIHLRGVTGVVKLKYIRYPKVVTQASDPVDIPESGYDALINEISSMIKSAKNFYDESKAMGDKAKAGYPSITQAAISGRGPSSGGQPPSMQDVNVARGG